MRACVAVSIELSLYDLRPDTEPSDLGAISGESVRSCKCEKVTDYTESIEGECWSRAGPGGWKVAVLFVTSAVGILL